MSDMEKLQAENRLRKELLRDKEVEILRINTAGTGKWWLLTGVRQENIYLSIKYTKRCCKHQKKLQHRFFVSVVNKKLFHFHHSGTDTDIKA